jgi:ABC-type transport system involved in multi-copper enzyme maturation permease subunit
VRAVRQIRGHLLNPLASALWAVAWRDWLTLRRDPRVAILTTIVTLLVPLAVYTNAREIVQLRSRAETIQGDLVVQRKARSETLTGRNVEPLLRIVREPSRGFMLVSGLERELPLYWDVGAAGLRVGPPAEGYSSRATYPNLDLEFIVRIVIGLFALLLGVDTLGRERQRRTLGGLLSQPVAVRTIIFGKCIANVALLALVAIWIAALSWSAIEFSADSERVPLRMIGALTAVSIGYLSTCFLIGFASSGMIADYHKAQTAALGVWLLVSIVSVPLVGSLAAALIPQRPRADFEGELDRAFTATTLEAERRLGIEMLGKIGRPDWWVLEKDPETHKRVVQALEPLWQEYAAAWTRDMVTREAHWQGVEAQQARLVRAVSSLAPGLLFRRLAAAACGTGDDIASTWHAAVVNYQTTLYETLVADRARLSLRVPDDGGFAMTALQRRPDLSRADVPHFVPPPAGRQVLPVIDLVVIAGQILILLGVTLFSTRRLRHERSSDRLFG